MRYIVLTLMLAACAPISPAPHTDTRDVEIIGTPLARGSDRTRGEISAFCGARGAT
ncbi:hypothetical protein [Celeribacter marinus]|uniref:Uncharacterized protein n=1 Tax=Celeribacter marinus TaxID=1397108 RepID=A0A0P0A1H0_9RHOB|nr:hypothetical protein [Celeribacter marinus]ALI56592.1 hypothetical protein IMCC12053_2645 [Celeribacter marinus]SFK59815.1 hypothetical protein SAMN05444421_10632 [Celeribacter marinus]